MQNQKKPIQQKKPMQNFTAEKWADKIALFIDNFGFLSGFFWHWTIALPSPTSHLAMLHSKIILSDPNRRVKVVLHRLFLILKPMQNLGYYVYKQMKNCFQNSKVLTRKRFSHGECLCSSAFQLRVLWALVESGQSRGSAAPAQVGFLCFAHRTKYKILNYIHTFEKGMKIKIDHAFVLLRVLAQSKNYKTMSTHFWQRAKNLTLLSFWNFSLLMGNRRPSWFLIRNHIIS